jgi:hypothetical protein
MKRIGPWIFAAGLVVLGAGIASTRSPGWKNPDRDNQVIALDLQGVDSLDIGDREAQIVRISSVPPAIHIQWYGRGAAEDDADVVSVIRDGRTTRLLWNARERAYAGVTLELPSTLRSLSGEQLYIQAQVNVGPLRIEAVDVAWQGNAQGLDIHALARPEQLPRDCNPHPSVTFDTGRVQQLRISIERGEVNLRDLSQVGAIEVHAGPGVALRVGRIDDLSRIKLLPFDGEPTPEPSTPEMDCRRGIRALL